MDSVLLTSFAILLIISGIGVGTYVANREGQLDFIKLSHYISLLLFIIAYILSWIAMTWMSNPNKFQVTPKQWIAFGFTILMAVFWWARYVFTIADTAETQPTN